MYDFTISSLKDDFMYKGLKLKPYHNFGDVFWCVYTNDGEECFAYFHEACEFIDENLVDHKGETKCH